MMRRTPSAASARVLPAGHRDRRVVQQLVRDVGAAGDGRPHGQAARVVERAVADVLQQVLAGPQERFHPDPLRALAAHLGQPGYLADRVRLHHQHQRVAADAAADHRAGRCLGRAVVRAAGAEVRRARDQRQLRHRAGFRGASAPGVHRRELRATQPFGQTPGDEVGVQLALGREQRVADGAAAGDAGCVRSAVEDLLDGRLHERALLLHHDDLVQAGRELLDLVRDQRVDHAQVQQPHPAYA
jgi:hypothetical protein